MNNILYFIVPCYNEEEVIEHTFLKLEEKMQDLIKSGKISCNSKILFVDDGSKDETWLAVSKLYESNQHVTAIKLSNNTGHQNALIAGLKEASNFADFVISIDADLQDDIGAVDDFIDSYLQGFEVVYGVRKNRDTDTFLKRFTAEIFYKILKFLGAKVVFNHADFRLMSKRVVNAVLECREVNLVLRGIIPVIGFRATTVEYDRKERKYGDTKYTFSKMFNLAVNAVTSFTISPLYFLIYIGILFSSLAFLGFVFYLISFYGRYDILYLILISIWFCFGVNMVGLGIIGIYLGKTYEEAKRRPKYFVETRLPREK